MNKKLTEENETWPLLASNPCYFFLNSSTETGHSETFAVHGYLATFSVDGLSLESFSLERTSVDIWRHATGGEQKADGGERDAVLVLISNSEQPADDFMGEMPFEKHFIILLYVTGGEQEADGGE